MLTPRYGSIGFGKGNQIKMPDDSALLVEQIESIRRLTLNRPEKRNAMNRALLTALYDEIGDAGADKNTSVIILRGAGTCFSSGGDLSESVAGDTPSATADDLGLRTRSAAMNRVWECPIPIVAQVHGWCLAAATDLVFCCDLIVVGRSARFGYPGVRTEGTPPMNMWLQYGGPQVAKWLMLTGNFISGEDAVARGLALSVHDDNLLEKETYRLASDISGIDRDILTANKSVLNFAMDIMGRNEVFRYAAAQNAIAHASSVNGASPPLARKEG